MADFIRTTGPGPNRFPLKAGARIKLTPIEQAEYSKLGWVQGDPIPVGLAEAIQQLKAEAEAEARNSLPVDPNTPPINPTIVDFDTLPEAKKAELVQAWADAKKQLELIESLPKVEFTDPSVLEAITIAQQAATIPDLPPEAAPAPVSDTGVAAPIPTTCPHCYRDTTVPHQVVVTDEDKRNYLQTLLGGTPFTKTTPLFGGLVLLKFRALSTKEARLVDEQVLDDARAGKLVTQLQFLNAQFTYRSALGLESVNFNKARAVRPELSTLHKTLDGVPQATVLPALVDFFETTMVPQESVRRAVSRAWQDFDRLVDKLEANADSADFYQGIVSPG